MALPTGYWEFSGTVTLGIWVRRSGAWQKVATVYASAYSSGRSGTQTLNWYYNGTLQLGTGIEAFGVTLDATDQTSATVNQITSVKWTAQGSSGGIRTALPNGSTTTITVRPK